jgi:hypothetical protein
VIIFGTRSYLYQLAIVMLVCGRCGNNANHVLRKRVTKFTLFFVPLFPISTRYSMQCSFCGCEQQGTEQQTDQMLAYANQQQYGSQQPYGQVQQPFQPGPGA